MDCPFALASQTCLKPVRKKEEEVAEDQDEEGVSLRSAPNKNTCGDLLRQECNNKMEVTGRLEEMIGSEIEEQENMKEYYTEYQEKEIKSESEVESAELEIEDEAKFGVQNASSHTKRLVQQDETYDANKLGNNNLDNKNAYLWVVKQAAAAAESSPDQSPPTEEPQQDSPKEPEKLLPTRKPSMLTSPPADVSPRGEGITTTTRILRVSDLCNSTSPRTYINKLSAILQGDTLKAVVFDIDGTVADSFPLHFLAFQETLVEVGYNGGEPITYEFFMSEMRGKLDTVIAQELMPWMDEAQHQQFLEEEAYRFHSLAATDLKPIQGFHRFIEWVKERGLKCAAVTDASHENAANILKILGVDDLFDILVVENECENNSDLYSIAFNKLGIEPNEAFILQDSPAGLKASIPLATTKGGLLTTEQHPAPLMSNGISLLIQDYDDPDLWTALGYSSELYSSLDHLL